MDLNKYIVKNDNNENKLFHSNGYAQVASGNKVGSTSDVTFNQRLEIDHKRKIIGEYRRSMIGSVSNIPRIRTVNRHPTKLVRRPIRTKSRPMPAPSHQKRGLFF